MTASEALSAAQELLAVESWSPDAIPLLRKAYELGARDNDTVQLLDRLYTRHGHWVEAGRWFPDVRTHHSHPFADVTWLKPNDGPGAAKREIIVLACTC